MAINADSLVLIVDDNPQNLQALGNMLKKNGYKVAVAENGADALDFAPKKHPDLILLDIMMPEMDGFEVCKRLKEDAETEKIPIIFLTARAETENVVKGFELGGVDYVTKPFNSAELVARINTQIKLKRAFNEIEALSAKIIDVIKTKDLEHMLMTQDKMICLGHVAAGIAHEIKNPLSSINIYANILHESYNREINIEKSKNIVTQIQSAANKIEFIIKRVIDFAKSSKPKFVLTNVNDPIEEAISLASVTLRKSGIKIDKALSANLPKCYVDPHLIEQVLLNLITNAAEAMKNMEAKKLQVASSCKAKNILVSVADSGPGVPTNLKNKIFDPFFTTKDNSIGIGLNISHRIITDHKGRLKIFRSEWGGAKFIIELPFGQM